MSSLPKHPYLAEIESLRETIDALKARLACRADTQDCVMDERPDREPCNEKNCRYVAMEVGRRRDAETIARLEERVAELYRAQTSRILSARSTEHDIATLQETIARLREALEPFAEASKWYDRYYCTGDVVLWQSRYGISVGLTVDDLWRARAALATAAADGLMADKFQSNDGAQCDDCPHGADGP